MKEKHNSYYDGITPESSNAEFLGRVLRKADTMENKKKNYNKKPIIIAAAAAFTLCAGVSAAAATGLIDFDIIFNGGMVADETIVAKEYLADVSSFTYNCSDEDYIFELNGVTGTNDYIYGSFEISRKDNAPVTDYYFSDLSTTDNLDCDSWMSWLKSENTIETNATHYLDFSINESGNINGYFGFQELETSAAGKTVQVSFDGIYDDVDYTDAKTEIFPLNISFGFDYLPSEAALKTRSIMPNNDSDINIIDSKLSFCYGYIEFNTYNADCLAAGDEFTLIKDDGTELTAHIYHNTSTETNGLRTEYIFFEYRESIFDSIVAVDISQVSKIRLGDSEFDLK